MNERKLAGYYLFFLGLTAGYAGCMYDYGYKDDAFWFLLKYLGLFVFIMVLFILIRGKHEKRKRK